MTQSNPPQRKPPLHRPAPQCRPTKNAETGRFFLMVRFPPLPDDSQPVRYEDSVHCFYSTDSKAVAEGLLEVFSRSPKNAETVYSILSAAEIPMADRVRFRECLSDMEKLSEWDRGDWQERPVGRKRVLVFQEWQQAQAWEPLVREELGIERGGTGGREAATATPGERTPEDQSSKPQDPQKPDLPDLIAGLRKLPKLPDPSPPKPDDPKREDSPGKKRLIEVFEWARRMEETPLALNWVRDTGLPFPRNVEQLERMAELAGYPPEEIAATEGQPQELMILIRARLIQRKAAQQAQNPKGTDEEPPEESTHTDDFTSVVWYGTPYTFTKTQAWVVRLLWEAWETSRGSLGQETICQKIDSDAADFRLSKVFRVKGRGTHPAWGTMIVPAGKGIYKLTRPESR